MTTQWQRFSILDLPAVSSDEEHKIKITIEIDGKVELEFEPVRVSQRNGGEFKLHMLEKMEWDPYAICQAPYLKNEPERRVWLMLSMGEPVDENHIYTYRVKSNE